MSNFKCEDCDCSDFRYIEVGLKYYLECKDCRSSFLTD